MQFAGSVSVAAGCIGPFDKLRAGSSARRKRGPQNDRPETGDNGLLGRDHWNGFLTVNLPSMTCPSCKSSVYKVVHLVPNAEARISAS